MKSIRIVVAALACVFALASAKQARAEDNPDSAGLQKFRDEVTAAYPGVKADDAGDVAPAVDAEPAPTPKRIALFVKNQSRKEFLDDEVDGLRDMMAADLAGAGLVVLDKTDIADSFYKYKITTDDERSGVVDGLFTGGSVVRTAQMMGADYIALVSIIFADKTSRSVGGQDVVTYKVSLATKVFEGSRGESVYGKTTQKTYPSTGGGGDEAAYYHDLFENAASEIAADMAGGMNSWRTAAASPEGFVSFTVHTTVDDLINGLEKGARGPNDVLNELRHVVSGATVELDGLALGSAPGTFKASPGLHQLRITRPWMEPWQKTVSIQDGADYSIALELSAAGLAKYVSQEGFKANAALSYAEAAYRKGIKIDFDSKGWRDVSIGGRGSEINVQGQDVMQQGNGNTTVSPGP